MIFVEFKRYVRGIGKCLEIVASDAFVVLNESSDLCFVHDTAAVTMGGRQQLSLLFESPPVNCGKAGCLQEYERIEARKQEA